MKRKMYSIVSCILAAVLLCTSVQMPVYAVEDVDGIAVEDITEIEEPAAEETTSGLEEAPAAERTLPEETVSETEEVPAKMEPKALEEIDPEEPIQVKETETENTPEEMTAAADDAYPIPELNYHEIPGEDDYESIKEHLPDDIALFAQQEALAAKYDPLKEADYLPTVRNQNPYGSCWAHSILGAAEIGLIKNDGVSRDGIDLSELQLAYFMYNSPETDPLGLVTGDKNYLPAGTEKSFLDVGGNVNLAKKIMQGWIGAGDDADELAYSNAPNVIAHGLNEKYAFADSYHLENYINVSIDERDEVKRAVMEYGAVTVSYYSDDKYYNSEAQGGETSYIYYGDKIGTNHAVLIVGWDDNYSKDNFLEAPAGKTPAGDGAWLIRNSWNYENTETYSKHNYFWMSYDDVTLKGGIAVKFAPADTYDSNYHYDASARDSADCIYPSGTKIANVFTAQGDNEAYEMLEAVAIELESTNVIYDIKIYKDLKDVSNPESGTPVSEVDGATSYEGYYTIPLDDFVPLKKGETFSVVADVSHLDESAVIVPKEAGYEYDWIHGTAGSRAGESFYNTGEVWVDEGAEGTGNFRIKAFTKNECTEVAATGVSFHQKEVTLSYGEKKALGVSVTPNYATDKRIIWKSSNPNIVSVADGKIEAVGLGEAVVTAELFADAGITASCTVRVIPDLKIGKPSGFTYSNWTYGSTVNLTAAFSPASAGRDYTAVWSSSDTQVVTVSADGVLTAVGKGTAEVALTTKENSQLGESFKIKVTRLGDIAGCTYNVANDNSKFSLSWQAVTGAESYEVRLYETAEDFSGDFLQEMNVSEPSCSVEYPLVDGASYGCTITAVNGDGTLKSSTARYRIRIYPRHKVSYVLNGGTNNSGNPAEIRESSTRSIGTPKRTGYTFGGWYTDDSFSGEAITSFSGIKEDITLYAKWTPNLYYIRYNGNGYTQGVMYESPAYYDQALNLAEVNYTRTGYTFDGWSTKRDGTGVRYADCQEVINLTVTAYQYVTLYAVWKLNTYTVEYDLDGGTNHPSNPASYTVEDGDITLLKPQKEGYTFAGWYDSDEPGVYAYNVLYTHECRNRKLCARWIEGDPPETPEEGGDIPEAPDGEEMTESPEDVDDSFYEQEKRLDLASTAAGTIVTNIKAKTYDGTAYMPAVKVTALSDGKRITLTEGTDYRVLYEHNIQAGTGRVIVKGNGIYTGTLTKEFSIQAKAVSKLNIVTGSMRVHSIEQVPVYVYDGAKLLTIEKDYKLILPSGMTASGGKKDVVVEAVPGGNYTGAKTVKVAVYDAENVLAAGDVTLAYTSAGYTGKALKPEVTVKYGGAPLDKKYYSVKYTNNKNAGTAFVTVTGRKGYSGSVVKAFTITPVKEVFTLKKNIAPVVYSGKLQKPGVTVKAGGKTLKKGRDYTLSYSDNLHAAKDGSMAHVTIKGIGNYADAPDRTFDFVIKPRSIKKVSIKGVKNELVLKCGTRVLVLNQDYTEEYDSKVTRGKVKVTLAAVEGSDFEGTVIKSVKADE